MSYHMTSLPHLSCVVLCSAQSTVALNYLPEAENTPARQHINKHPIEKLFSLIDEIKHSYNDILNS